MERIKEVLSKIKEIWKVPKYKGLIQIGLWIIFFILVFVFINVKNHIKMNAIDNYQEEQKETTNSTPNQIKGYLYNYQISNGESIINISGTYYDGIDLFTFDNNRYYLKENTYYNVLDRMPVSFNYPLNEYQYNNISSLIKDRQFESKTEYKDGKIEYTYIIDNQSYNSFYQKDYQSEGNINLKITYQNDYISSVNIDFTNYNNSQVIISYSNVNNIYGLDINIE